MHSDLSRLIRPLTWTALLAVILFCLPAVARAQGPLTNGGTHTGAISAPGEMDEWTFSAPAGATIVVSIGEIGADSPFYPWVRLLGPTGTQLAQNWGALGAEIAVTAPSDGVYTVVADSADGANTATGQYSLVLAVMPGAFVVPDEGGALVNGANNAGVITRADLDLWSFSANGGESVVVSIGEVGGDSPFYPYIAVYGPTGTRLQQNWGAVGAELAITAPTTGTYTVLVDSADGAHAASGNYTLTYARMPGTFVVPPNDQGGPLTNGNTHSGTIATADLDLWSFTANGGDNIVLSLGEVGADSPFYPYLAVYGPTGTRLQQNWGALGAELAITAPATGSYTVLIDSADGAHAYGGDYTLTYARMPGSFTVPTGDQGGALTNGGNHSGTIDRADLDLWSFTANGGDAFIVSIGETGGDSPFYPYIAVYGPTGARLQQDWGAVGAELALTAPASGTYTVLVDSADGAHSASGNYMLRFVKVPGTFAVPTQDESGPLTSGVTTVGTIAPADLDPYIFCASPGRTITISLAETGGDSAFWPYLRVYRPNGGLVASNWGSVATQVSFNATDLGSYTVVVGSADGARSGSGPYTLQASGICAPPPPPPGDPNGDLVLDFGASLGMWLLADYASPSPQWQQLHGLSPVAMARGDLDRDGLTDIIVSFGGGGTWRYEGGTWTMLHGMQASAIAIGDLDGNGRDDIVVNFQGAGLWAGYDDGTWRQLHPFNSSVLAMGQVDNDSAGRSDLVVSFPGYGVYLLTNNTTWTALHPTTATMVKTADMDADGRDEVVLNFPGVGIWIRYGSGTWSQLHGLNAVAMAVGNVDGDAQGRKDLVVTFAGYGVYVRVNNTSWTHLHGLAAPVLATAEVDYGSGRDDVVMEFPGYGVWLWRNNARFEQLHGFDIEDSVGGSIDEP